MTLSEPPFMPFLLVDSNRVPWVLVVTAASLATF